MHASHVVVDTRDGWTWARDASNQLLTEDTAREWCDRINAGMKPEHQTYEVFTLTPLPAPVVTACVCGQLPALVHAWPVAECSECGAAITTTGGTTAMPVWGAVDGAECTSGIGHVPAESPLDATGNVPPELCETPASDYYAGLPLI